MVMDKKKAEKLEQMEAEMARLWEQSQNETDNKKKQKLIQNRNKLQWKAAAMRSGRKLSKQTRDDLVAYSFIAPNFIGFAVFTLIPIIFAFILAFTEWDGNNPIQFVGLSNFLKLPSDTFFTASLKNTIIYLKNHGPYRCDGNEGCYIREERYRSKKTSSLHLLV